MAYRLGNVSVFGATIDYLNLIFSLLFVLEVSIIVNELHISFRENDKTCG